MKYNPTEELYNLMTELFKFFNAELFDNSLPNVLFTTQRQPNTMGYYSPNRWKNTNDDQCDEIAINPMYIGKSTIMEMMQTLVHEMCHQWQQLNGKVGKNGYHNKEWAEKMESVGLVPSSTGMVDGEKTGFKMNDYPNPSGKFLTAYNKLMASNNTISKLWVDRFAIVQKNLLNTQNTEQDIEVSTAIANVVSDNPTALMPVHEINNMTLDVPEKPIKRKFKFTCLSCKMNVWGGVKVKVKCGNCNLDMTKED